jgi:branched-chain amino acid transport system permease protein
LANDRDHGGGPGLLATRRLSVYYDQFQAVREVDFSIGAGEIVALIGANGAGKSSFLKAIVGQVDRTEGAIEFCGQNLSSMSTPAISAAGIALVPEGRRLFPSLTVDENLRIGLSIGRRGPITLDQVYQWFPSIASRRGQLARSLSGGEQQMVALGRALLTNPLLLLCDEISLGLAPVVVGQLYEFLPSLRSSGMGLLVVEQDVRRSLAMTDRFYCLLEGAVCFSGHSKETDRETIMALELINQIIQGALIGGLYVLFAIGLSLSLGVMRFVNIAHGDLIVLASFILMSFSAILGLSPFIAAALLMPAAFLAFYALQRLLLQRLVGTNLLGVILVTFGLAIVIQNGLLQTYGPDTRKLSGGALELKSISIGGGLSIGLYPLLVFATAVVVIFALDRFLYRTSIGSRIRAVADDPAAANLIGLPSAKIYGIAMGVVGLTVMSAACCMSVWTNFDPEIGPSRLLIAFEVVVLGGLGSLWGTLVGGIIIGVAQNLGAQVDAAWQILAQHLVFLVILFLRPQGLFPRGPRT